MSKYVFKNAEFEKSLRLIAKEIGVSDKEFDDKVQLWGGSQTVYIDRPDDDRIGLDFPASLLIKVEDFNPTGWNDSEVIPPEGNGLKGFSEVMLVEDEYGFPKKGVFSFTSNQWLECGPLTEMHCSRYRLYPTY